MGAPKTFKRNPMTILFSVVPKWKQPIDHEQKSA
jgi:hypothetical protein